MSKKIHDMICSQIKTIALDNFREAPTEKEAIEDSVADTIILLSLLEEAGKIIIDVAEQKTATSMFIKYRISGSIQHYSYTLDFNKIKILLQCQPMPKSIARITGY